MAQEVDQLCERSRRKRGILAHDDIDQRIHGRRRIRLRRGNLAHLIESNTAGAPGNAQMAAIVEAFKKLCARIRSAAEPVAGLSVLEMVIDVAWVDSATFPNEGKDSLGLLLVGARPGHSRGPRMHHGVGGARQKAVVDKDVFLDAKPGIEPLKIARSVVADTMAKREVLRTRWRADGVGLHEAEPVDGAAQRRRREQGS